MRAAFATTIVLANLCACSGGRTAGIPAGIGSGDSVRSQVLLSSDFKHAAAWGSKGAPAVAQCPQGYRVIAGGSGSSDGSFVGTGSPSGNNEAWVAKPMGSASAEAFATCVAAKVAYHYFRWISAGPVSGIAAAQCVGGFTLVTGYNLGTAKASWFDASTNTYWVTGGASAYASCARPGAGILIRHAWNQSQNPKDVYAGCGTGYAVIAGAMGNTAWPGPPTQEHPGDASGPSVHGYHGWWTFSNAQNQLTWAACVKTST